MNYYNYSVAASIVHMQQWNSLLDKVVHVWETGPVLGRLLLATTDQGWMYAKVN